MNRITFGKVFEPQPPSELIPETFLGAGDEQLTAQWSHDRILVFIQQAAYKAMHAHARSDLRRECTGLMVGQVFHDPEQKLPFVIIEQIFAINATAQSSAHVHVDADRFAQARSVIERQYPGNVIVGWYHTHPNLGIFLSGTDRQVTEGLFNASWHIATVIDPVRNDEGSFVERGANRISGLVVSKRHTPITLCLSLYRQGQGLIESGDFTAAANVLRRLQEYFHEASASPQTRPDLRLWQPGGTYRDLPALLTMAEGTQMDAQSGAGDGPLPYVTPYSLERQLQDIQRGQTDLAHELKQLNQRLTQTTRHPLTAGDLIGLLLGLLIAVLLGVDIYLQQVRNQTLVEQNQHLSELVQQNHSLERTLLLLATPIPVSGAPDVTVAPASPTAAVPTAALAGSTTLVATTAPTGSTTVVATTAPASPTALVATAAPAGSTTLAATAAPADSTTVVATTAPASPTGPLATPSTSPSSP